MAQAELASCISAELGGKGGPPTGGRGRGRAKTGRAQIRRGTKSGAQTCLAPNYEPATNGGRSLVGGRERCLPRGAHPREGVEPAGEVRAADARKRQRCPSRAAWKSFLTGNALLDVQHVEADLLCGCNAG